MVGGSGTQDVKQRALQVAWKSRLQPTEAELGSAFRPFGEIVRIQIKDKCAAVLFDSAESVIAAAESSWDGWDVRLMTKITSKQERASLKAAEMDRKEETSIDTPFAAEGARSSRPGTAVRRLATVPAGRKGVDLRAMELGGSATSKEDSDVVIDDATRMRNAYSSRSMTNALCGDRAQGQGGGVHPNSKQWKTAREQGQPADSSKESLRPVDDDRLAPRQRSPLFLSSRSDDGGGTDAPIDRTTRRSMRETRPRSHGGSSEDYPMGQRQIRQHSAGDTSKTQEGNTSWNPRMVDRDAADAVAFVADNESEPVPCPPLKRDALDAASGESDVFWQNLSPLSSPEGLATPTRERDKEGGHQIIDAEETGSDPAIHGDGRDGSRALPADSRKTDGVGDGKVPLSRGEATPEESCKHHANAPHQLLERRQPRVDVVGLSSLDTAPAAAIETAYPLAGGQAEGVGGVLGQQVSEDRKRQGVGEGKDDNSAAEQKRARHQAKRLALEVARLRAALRRTASDLKTERATRERLEGEWWKKMGEWEVERGRLVATKQEAERAFREAAEETALARKQAEARDAKVASDRDAQEAAQCKANSAMNGVVEVQDRLVRALQAELDMTNRAREATQDDAREATEQLRFYVQDFLLWRDRAKRLEARMVELGHPEPWVDADDGTPRSCVWPLVHTSPSAQHPSSLQRKNRDRRQAVQHPENAASSGGANDDNPSSRSDNIVGSADNSGPEGEVSGGPEENCTQGSPSLPSKAQRGPGEVGGCAINIRADTSVPERHTICLDSPRYQSNANIDAQLRGLATAEAAPAWPSGLAVGGGQSPASRAYFQRSMEAQQEVSARLERDLIKARADLKAIYGGDKVKSNVGARVGLLPREGGTDAGRYMEGGHDVARDANSLAGTRGEGRRDNLNSDDRPLSCGGLSTDGGDSVQPQHPTSQHNAIGACARESNVAPINSRGPYMIRVLAALLGDNTIAKATAGLNGTKNPPVYDETRRITERGLKNSLTVEAPPPSLRLTDFSPTLQAVFCGGESVLSSPAGAMSGRTLPAARERDGEIRRQQGLRHQAWSGHHSNTGERNGQASQLGTRSIVSAANLPEHAGGSAPTISAALNQSSRDGGGDKRYQEKAEAGAASDLRGSASCALAGAFREYEAKSPLLQRWMLERFPSPSAGTPVV